MNPSQCRRRPRRRDPCQGRIEDKPFRNCGLRLEDYEQTPTGDYEVKFDLDNVTGAGGDLTQEVRIQRYELPEFSVTATPDRAFYLAGEEPKVVIHAGYLFGKPVASGGVRLVRADDAEWNPKTGRYDEPKDIEDKAQLDVNGDATLKLKVTDEFDQLKSDTWERFRDVKYRAMVTDATTGRTEPRNFAVRLTKEPVHIYLNPIGSSEQEEVPDLSNRICRRNACAVPGDVGLDGLAVASNHSHDCENEPLWARQGDAALSVKSNR